MNTETGRIYYGEQEIAEATARGEPLAQVSAEVARLMEMGRAADQGLNRYERRRRRFGNTQASDQR